MKCNPRLQSGPSEYKIYVDKIDDLNMVINHDNIKADHSQKLRGRKYGMVVGRLGVSLSLPIKRYYRIDGIKI